MTINDKIRVDINPKRYQQRSSKISTLSSGKIKKYWYLIGEEILPPDLSETIEQAKFTYFPLGKALEKQKRSRRKKMNATEELGKQLVEFNVLVKYDYDYKTDYGSHLKQR